MKKKNRKILYDIAICYCFVLIGFLGYYAIDNYERPKVLSEPIYSEECNGLDVPSTSYCLRNQLSKFYKYNITNINQRLTFDELKYLGGVCSHYADWYIYQMKNRGFNSEEIIFKINETIDHKVAVVSDSYNYCVLDQLQVGCVELAGGEDE